MNRRDVLRVSVGAIALAAAPSHISAQQGTPAPSGDPANPFLFGNGLDRVPAGHPNTVEVVSHGSIDFGWLPFLIRNSTASPIEVKEVIGAFRDASGKLLDTVRFADFAPRTLFPNGVAIGYATFDKDSVPLDAQIELVAKVAEGPGTTYVELPITKLDGGEVGFEGTVQNTTSVASPSGIQVVGVTMGEDGTPMGSFSGSIDAYELPQGEVGSFDCVLNGEPSAIYLAAAYARA
jgi:hypothetical protein